MSQPDSPHTIDYEPGRLDEVIAFQRQMRYEFRELRYVRVWPDRVEVFDVNNDCYVVRGLGYPMPDVVPVLDGVNAVYRRDAIHEPTSQPFKEFKTGRRYTWADDRVM